nr:hypothetical protein [Tanacetum cinerariifolium]
KIRTRKTPTALFNAMAILNDDRKECLHEMAFESMIGMGIHELSGKLDMKRKVGNEDRDKSVRTNEDKSSSVKRRVRPRKSNNEEKKHTIGSKGKKHKSSSKSKKKKKSKIFDDENNKNSKIRTRKTPTALFNAMAILNDDRKECLHEMAFESMIGMGIHELSGKLEILSGADNHPPMLEKDMHDLWKSKMELYMMNRQHERMILECIENGPLLWPTVEENGVTRPKKYSELSAAEAIQADCDVKATNIILQGLPPEIYALKGDDPIDAINHMMSFLTAVVTSRYPPTNNQLRNSSNPRQQATINNGKVTEQPIQGRHTSLAAGEPLSEQSNIMNQTEIEITSDSNIFPYSQYKAQQFEPKLYDGNVTKKSNAIVIRDSEETLMLAEEIRSKMLLKQKDMMMSEKKETIRFHNKVDLHTTNVDQLHAYLGQHEYYANEVRLMNEQTFDPLALISQHQLNRTPYPHHQTLYPQSQFQPQATSYQSSPYGPTYHNSQFVSSGPSSLTHSISYPGTDTSSLVNHNAYMASSSAPQIAYAQMDQQSSELSPPEAGLVLPVFQKGDDPIDAINHMMSFLTSVVASRYPETNNQLRTSSNPRQGGAQGKQRVITCYNCKGEGHMSKQCTKPRRKRDAEWFKDKVLLVQAQANGQVLQEEELEFLADPAVVNEAVISHPIDLEMLKVDVAPLAPKLQNNRTLYSDYLKHT